MTINMILLLVLCVDYVQCVCHQIAGVCSVQCQAVLSRLSSERDKVALLQQHDTDGQSSTQMQFLLSELSDKFNLILEYDCYFYIL